MPRGDRCSFKAHEALCVDKKNGRLLGTLGWVEQGPATGEEGNSDGVLSTAAMRERAALSIYLERFCGKVMEKFRYLFEWIEPVQRFENNKG